MIDGGDRAGRGLGGRQALTDSPPLKHLLKSPLNMTSKWFNGIDAPLGPRPPRRAVLPGRIQRRPPPSSRCCCPRDPELAQLLEQPNLPFLFVQLPGFIEHRADQDRQLDMDAATLAALHQPGCSPVCGPAARGPIEHQRSVPHTGMAVTIDVGEPYDIHPKQKRWWPAPPAAARSAGGLRRERRGE